MRYLIIAVMILSASAMYAQQRPAAQAFDEVDFLDTLGNKNIATVADAQRLFDLVLEKKQEKNYPVNDTPLTKGYIASMVAGKLNLEDSMLYKLFKSQRYAFRVCVAHNLLNADGSEYDKMSGEELIEFLTLASEYGGTGEAE